MRGDYLSQSKQNEVLGLLTDYAAFRAAFGGALPLDESHLQSASYGPAGYVPTGVEFHEEGSVPLLRKSYGLLNAALRLLRRDHMDLWIPLVEPYLSDPGDPGLMEHWRRRVAELDEENRDIRRHNDLVKKGKKSGHWKHEKVALVVPRMLLKRHDKAIEQLAEYLRDVDLYYIPVSQLSESEARADEHREAQMYASYQRYRVARNRHEQAVECTAHEFGTSTDKVETVIEFRRNVKADECSEAGCDRAPFSQNLCTKHYFQKRRSQTKSRNAS